MTGEVFALVHSPLVGPLTWSLVGDQLHARGYKVIVPTLRDRSGEGPFWQQHATSVLLALRRVDPSRRIILVAHSGAGPLIPTIAAASQHRAAAYVFVDATLPLSGSTRLDTFPEELHKVLIAGGRYPTWTFDDLEQAVPDPVVRRALLEELQPRSLDFFAESIPVFAGWPDAPCAYLCFSAPYRAALSRVREQGWICEEMEAGHFHMLVDPAAVTEAILRLARM